MLLTELIQKQMVPFNLTNLKTQQNVRKKRTYDTKTIIFSLVLYNRCCNFPFSTITFLYLQLGLLVTRPQSSPDLAQDAPV